MRPLTSWARQPKAGYSRARARAIQRRQARTQPVLELLEDRTAPTVTITNISPTHSDNGDADAASGGRVNHLASVQGTNQIFYAASEYGGLFKTTDGGDHWSHLDRHLPQVTWDVKVDPSNASRVYATSFYDGRVNSIAGIQVSTDAGATWTNPATAHPPPGFGAGTAGQELSAYGIGIRPDATNQVYIGTSVGLATSTDSGLTWTFSNPVAARPNQAVFSVLVQAGGPTSQGIIDIIAADGHHRSTNAGVTWSANNLPSVGFGQLSVSPDESYVLFATGADNNLYESDDAGATWTNKGNPNAQGRVPFSVTNKRAASGGNNHFDVWFGDVSLYRATGTTPAVPMMGGANRIPNSGAWAGGFTRSNGGHDDTGDLVFDRTVTVDSPLTIMASDGGVYRNTNGSAVTPAWTQPTVTPQALWTLGMAGVSEAGRFDLYFSNQDNGPMGSTNANAATPTWHIETCCDAFDAVADANRVLYSNGFFSGGRGIRLFKANAGMTGSAEIPNYPDAASLAATWTPVDDIAQFGATSYVLVMSDGVFTTTDITASPIVWTQLGTASTPANPIGIKVGISSGTPTFYLEANLNGGGQGERGDSLWKFTGTGSGTWTRVDNNSSLTGGFGVFAVDPNNPNRLFASNLPAAGPKMVFSTDGGTTWQTDAALDTMMTGGGVFKYQNTFGPTSTTFSTNGIQNFPQRQGYPQPSLVAYDPTNGNNIVAGGHDSGVFLSTDGGTTWQLLDDPINGDTSTQHIPRPWFAAFDHRPAGTTEIYIGTQGRGVYRMSGITLSVMAPGNQTAAEGANQPFNLGSFTDPDGGPWSVDVNWGDMGPHTTFTTTTTGSLGTRTHTFGEEGTYTVTVMVTDTTGGDSDSKTFTVTVSDPAVLATGVPVSAVEGAAFAGRAVATFTDPGGAEPNPSDPDPELSHHYTAMINWGDPTPPTAGTITFSAGTFTVSGNHTYGEEGTFTVTTTINHEGIITVTTSTASVSDPAVLPKGVPVFAVACRTFTAEVATFTDPGGAEPNPSDPDPELSHHYTAMIDWGDLTPPSAGTITYSGPPGSTTEPFIVTGTHAYALEGIYTVTTTIDHESIISVTTSTATIKDDIGLLLLDPTGSKSLFVTGNGSVTATECGAVVVDSNNARDAAFLAGHGTVTAQDIDVTGGARTVGHGSFSVAVDHETATPDPLGLALPPPPSMHFPAVHYSGDAPLTLSPGTYDGGIEITGHGAVTLLPGIYYLNGGGFRVSGKGSVTGDDVLIVNAPGGPEDTIDISGQGAVTLTALSSGPYQGVVILQDPASADPLHFTGQGAVTLTGVVYVPDAPVSITGNANVTINPGPGTAVAPPPILGALIAFDLKVAGNGVLTINPDDPAGPGAPSSPGRGLFVSRAVNAGLNDGDSAQGDDAFLGQIVFLLSRDQQAGRPSPASAPVTRSGAGTTAASPAALDWLFSGNSGDTGSAWSRENVPADRSHAAWVDPLGGQLVDELLSSLVQVA